MSKGKPRNTRGAISDLYLSELAELSPDERENSLVFGDTLASDFAKYEQTATDIEGDVEPNPLTLIHQEPGTSRAVLRQTGAAMVSAISEWEVENPTEAKELKALLSRKMDTKSKTIVKKLKAGQL